jgi:hypothetical protein
VTTRTGQNTTRFRAVPPAVALLLTLAIFAVILRRVPLVALSAALHDADYPLFLALMIPNTLFYFAWDTLVLAVVVRWFHGAVPYRDLLSVRAASYVVGFFNTNLGRGALAAYLCRRLKAPFLELGSTVIFLVLTEYTQLVLWSLFGLIGFRAEVTASLLSVAAIVAAFWVGLFLYTKLHLTPARAIRWAFAPREWPLLRTFRLATAARYGQVVLLRAPMFFVSLCAHYYAAHAFGIHIPFRQMLTFLPVIFMLAALPTTVAHLGTTQAAWIFFFSQYAPAPRLLAFSLAAHVTFTFTRALLGVIWLPAAWLDLLPGAPPDTVAARALIVQPDR